MSLPLAVFRCASMGRSAGGEQGPAGRVTSEAGGRCQDYSAIAKGQVALYYRRDLGETRAVDSETEKPKLMAEHPRITLAPDILAGKPVIRGTRLAVEFIIGLMAEGWTEVDILTNYAGITHDDIIACLAYARDSLSSEKVFPSAA